MTRYLHFSLNERERERVQTLKRHYDSFLRKSPIDFISPSFLKKKKIKKNCMVESMKLK